MTIETINDGESGASVLGKLNGNFAELRNGRDTLNWWAGRTEITILGVGDSNSAGSGGVDPGVIPDDTSIRLWVNPTGAVPYSTASHAWGYFHPDSALRSAEYASAITLGYTTHTGQLMGGNGNPAWALANRMSASTDVIKYVFQSAKGGTRMDFWASGDGWDSLEAEVPVALAAIPGSPTAFDVILIGAGTNDNIQSRTGEQFYTDFDTFRTNAQAEGWWGPDTLVFIMECPINGSATGYLDGWLGYEHILNRSDERVCLLSAAGLENGTGFDVVHFLPSSYVKFGRAGADIALSGRARPSGAVRDNTYVQKLAPVLGGDLDADGFAIITPDIESASGVTAIDISPEGNVSYKMTYAIDTSLGFTALTMGGATGALYQSRAGASTTFPAHNFNTDNALTGTGPIAAFSNNDVVKASVDKDGFFDAPGYNGNPYGGLIANLGGVAEAAVTTSFARIIEAWTGSTLSNVLSPDYTTGWLPVPAGAGGRYRVTGYLGFLGSVSETYEFFLKEDSAILGFGAATAATTSTGGGRLEYISGNVLLAAGERVGLYVKSSTGGTVFQGLIGELYMERIDA